MAHEDAHVAALMADDVKSIWARPWTVVLGSISAQVGAFRRQRVMLT